jgi:RNA-binding protein YhbY
MNGVVISGALSFVNLSPLQSTQIRQGTHFLCLRAPRHHSAANLSMSDLSGQDRRALRSEAGKREAAGMLSYLQLPTHVTRDPGYKAAASELHRILGTDELVRVRTGQKKKKFAREVGDSLAAMVGGAVCQTIGHTVLVYKEAPSNRKLRTGLSRIKLPSGRRATSNSDGDAAPAGDLDKETIPQNQPLE